MKNTLPAVESTTIASQAAAAENLTLEDQQESRIAYVLYGNRVCRAY
jgi:hypothetical protein